MASVPAPEAAAPRRERAAPLPSDASSAGGLSGATGSSRRDEASQAARKQDALRSTLAPDQWIERIVALYDAGRLDDAARELRALRAAHRDAEERLPRRLRPWADSVTR
jgi:hypothetical protein